MSSMEQVYWARIFEQASSVLHYYKDNYSKQHMEGLAQFQ